MDYSTKIKCWGCWGLTNPQQETIKIYQEQLQLKLTQNCKKFPKTYSYSFCRFESPGITIEYIDASKFPCKCPCHFPPFDFVIKAPCPLTTAFRPDRHDTKPWSWRPQWHSNVPKDKHGTRPEAGRGCFFPGISGWVTWGSPTQPVVGKIRWDFFLIQIKDNKTNIQRSNMALQFF